MIPQSPHSNMNVKADEDFEIKPQFIFDTKEPISTPKKQGENKVNTSNSAYKDGPSQEMLNH